MKGRMIHKSNNFVRKIKLKCITYYYDDYDYYYNSCCNYNK